MKQAIIAFDTPVLQTYINFMPFFAATISPKGPWELYVGENLKWSR